MWRAPVGLRGILFDKDGTLIDFARTWTSINRKAAALASQGDSDLERKLLIGCGTDPATGHTASDSLFAAGNSHEIATRMHEIGSPFQPDELTRMLDKLFVQGAHSAIAITDLQRLFDALRQLGLKTGIASSDNEASIRATITAQGLDDRIDFVAGYDSGFGTKPQPGMARAFCRHIGCAPGQFLMIGDNRHDMEMGRAAGSGGNIGVLSGTGDRSSLEPYADILLTDVSELPALLQSQS